MDRLQRYRALITLLALAMAALTGVSCARQDLRADARQEATQETVVVRNLDIPGAFEVENRGPALELASRVVVQKLEGGAWTDRATDLILAETCDWNPKPGCRTVERGAKLRPPRWNGLVCSGQCPLGCRANLYLGPGQFRFVVTSCDRKQRFFGPAFIMPDYDHSEPKKKEG